MCITHSPPWGCRDRASGPLRLSPVKLPWEEVAQHRGSRALRHAIELKRPRVVVCGHVHEDRGQWRVGDSLLFNATIRDEHHDIRYPAMQFELSLQVS